MIGIMIFKKYSSSTAYDWVYTVSNTGSTIRFAGVAGSAEQYQNVQLLAQSMTNGVSEVLSRTTQIFDTASFPPNSIPPQVLEDTFKISKNMYYGNDVVIEAAQVLDYDSVMIAAGERFVTLF